jgi:SAM-dependent methyltransferase
MGSSKEWDGQRETLDDLSAAVHYNQWIYEMLRPHLGNRILEIGCGTGNLTGFFARHGQVLASDVHLGYLKEARQRLKGIKHVSFQKINLDHQLPALKRFGADTIVCVNVLEHIKDDHRVLLQCLRLLKPGGKLLLFVPALPYLFGSMDESYGHFRRYSRPELMEKVGKAGFQVDYCRYLNLLGVPGWWLNGKVLKRKIIPKAQMMLYDRVVSFTSKIERFLPKPIGLSLFCVGLKPSTNTQKSR